MATAAKLTGNVYAWAVSVIAATLAVGNVILGAIITAMPGRLGGASFMWVVQLARPQVWGMAFILSGLLGLFGQYTHRMWPARIAHTAAAFICAYWVGAFAYAGYNDPKVSLTGTAAYAIIAACHLIVAVVSPHRAY